MELKYRTFVEITLLLACSVMFYGCGQSEDQSQVRVFAASSLREVFLEARSEFQPSNPSIVVDFNFGGSSMLRTQLELGGGADVFASADGRQMSLAEKAGVVSQNSITFAKNRLAVATSVDNTRVMAMQDLARDEVRLVLAQPEVPIGAYAREVLDNMSEIPKFGEDYIDKVLSNVISLEINVSQIIGKIAIGEADAGVVYSTNLVSGVGEKLKSIPMPHEINVEASYFIAVTSETESPEAAEAFIDYLLSPKGQALLTKYGFGLPQ